LGALTWQESLQGRGFVVFGVIHDGVSLSYEEGTLCSLLSIQITRITDHPGTESRPSAQSAHRVEPPRHDCDAHVVSFIFTPSDISRESLKFYSWTFFFFFIFYQSTALSSHAVDGHQMYFERSVVGKASTIGIEISPTPPLIFTGGQNVRNLASFLTSLNLSRSRLKM